MAAESGVFLFYTFFQLAGLGILAAAAREGRSRVLRPLVVLLALNAGLSAIEALRAQSFYPTWVDRVHQALDAPSGFLLLTAIALHAGRRNIARWLTVLAAIASLFGLAFAHDAADAPVAVVAAYYALVAIPYYVGLGWFVVTLAGSDMAAERWLAIAYLPRGLLFPAQSFLPPAPGNPYLPGLLPPSWSWLTLQTAFNAVVGLLCITALYRLLRARPVGGPDTAVILGIAAVGPLDAYAWRFVPGDSFEALVASSILNFVTLSFVRPLFQLVAFAPDQVWRLLGRAAFAAGVGTLLIWAAPALGLPAIAAGFLAISLGSVTLLLLRALTVASHTGASHIVAHSVAGEAPGAPPMIANVSPYQTATAATTLPQWQTLLLELARAGAHGDAAPRAEWTQRGLAETTGIDVKRVSAFPDVLNGSAAERLDGYLPGWRSTPGVAADPRLVTVQKGHVPGLRGVRVYYRLTPLGLRLADTIRASLDSQIAAESVRNRPHA